ncbi:MAG TPA: sulfatase [Thermoanaerobaculia bacterium]|nr:sulfatase [Thermoanaerobaculia bacterium]
MKRSTLALLLPLLLLTACGPSQPSGEVRLLLDGDHAPDVLTERKDVADPPALGGNRFLSGWWPWKNEGTLVLSPIVRRARVQIVNLEHRERTLVLDLLEEAASRGRKVRVEADGRNLGVFPLTDPVEVPLPADLPLGRVTLDLSFDEGSRGVVAAAVRPILPEGKVKRWKADLIQSGVSLVEMVRPVSGGETLMGSFIPPTNPQPGQRFDLIVAREDGSPIRRFTWAPSFWNRVRGTRSFAYRIGDIHGFVRVRLWAHGVGPAGRWKELRLVGESPERTQRTERTERTGTPPPRLVILYVNDALRADAVGVLGGPPGISPTYDRLAREGLLFRAHRSVAPNTLPSTKALFTGRTFVSRGGWKLEPEDGATLAEMFRAAGYRTGLFSGNVYVSPAYKTDRGFEHVAEEVQIDGLVGGAPAVIEAPYNDNAERAHAAALAWLRTLRPGEKAFLYIHTIHPHNPYDPPEPFRSRFTQGIPSTIDGSTPTLTGIKALRVLPSEADKRRLRGLYRGSFSYNDDQLGRFLAQVAAFAPPRETLIAMTADHGEELFDHGGVLHGFTVFEELLRIPLVLWAPGRIEAGEVSARTDTLDLHATLLELCGLKPPGGHPAEGRSLFAVARDEDQDVEKEVRIAAASSVKGGIYAALSGKWKLVWAPRVGTGWGQGDGAGRSRDPEYLFDLDSDPKETTNLAGEGDYAVAWLRSRLLAWIENNREEEEKEPAGSQAVDPETLNKLRALGYVN